MYGGVLGFLGYILTEKVGLLKSFKFTKKSTQITFVFGLLSSSLFLIDYYVFANLIPQVADSYVKGAVTPLVVISSILYGGIIEEIMIRLFLMSLLVFILWKLFAKNKTKEQIPTWIFIVANVISAFVFAASHLPATIALLGGLTTIIIIRCFLLNGVFGMIFGDLFYKYGIQYAILAHMLVHIVTKTLQIIIIG